MGHRRGESRQQAALTFVAPNRSGNRQGNGTLYDRNLFMYDGTGASQRFVSRHPYDQALQANARRLEQRPDMMSLRRQTVEHPFGTIKHQILGNARLLMEV